MTEQMTEQDDVPAGQLRFVTHYEPGLPSGHYDVTASQAVSAVGATVAPVTRSMLVSGPRFALDPSDIHAQYPPAAANGTFAGVLPHIVFTKRLLPWERPLPTGDKAVKPDPGTPWLALLAFQLGELLVSGDTGPAKAAVAGYAATTTVSALLAEGSASVRVPDLTPDTADEAAMSCQVISITNDTFARIVPVRRELPFLAHGRQVDVTGKVLLDMPNLGQFSVAVANRFPLPGTETVGAPCIVHLVSLEGFGDLLNGAAPVRPPQPMVKLISLFSWTFGCLQDKAQTFAGLAGNLAFDGQERRPAQSLPLRLPLPAADATDKPAVAVNTRLSDGYLALGYHTRAGDDGFAWYRGPLAPSVTQPVFPPGQFLTADAAMIFDPATGVFDLSLAAAWQCGRSLALADQAYAGTLMRLRQQLRNQLSQMTVGDADLPGGTGPAHPALAALFRDGLLQQVGDAAKGRHPLARPPRRRSRPTRPAPVQRLRALLARAPAQATLTDGLDTNPDAAAVAAWLGRLALLQDVPFDHLVADARMLPPESIRFSYLDQNWIRALIDGALAIGLGTTAESSLQEVLTGQLAAMAEQDALAVRATALGQPVPPAPAGPAAAILIRSALVAGWPGVVVQGTLADAGVPLLRLDAVQPDVLIAVFAGVPDTVLIEAPHEGLAFGVDEVGQIVTRTLSGPAIKNGAKVVIYDPDAPARSFPSLRPGGARVLNVNTDPAYPAQRPPDTPLDLLGMIARALAVGTATLDPAVFSLQMIQGPERVIFTLTPATAATAGSTAGEAQA